MTERRIVMFNQVSADGFFSDSSGALDWVVNDPDVHRRAVARMPETGGILFGRRTYENFAAFWPGALADLQKAGPHGENKADPAFAAMAHWLNDTKKLVASRTLTRVDWNNTEVMPELNVQVVRALKKQPGKDILIFGSGTVVSQLSEAQLIDEYRFVVCPVLLGSGQSLLRSVSLRLKLDLKEALALPSGNVLVTYEPKR
ncbi:MAG: deaminase [Polyangiaceae bacterium]|jgi:dihydrofolate reductase|nr:deaminase [Polyangiaceae bacterium]